MGSQFVSLAFRPGRCQGADRPLDGIPRRYWDSAAAESVFATQKKEVVHRRASPTREELRREVFDYIEIFYSATRRHGTVGILPPACYEKENASLELLNDINDN